RSTPEGRLRLPQPLHLHRRRIESIRSPARCERAQFLVPRSAVVDDPARRRRQVGLVAGQTEVRVLTWRVADEDDRRLRRQLCERGFGRAMEGASIVIRLADAPYVVQAER